MGRMGRSSDEILESRVSAGIEFLNKYSKPNWFDQIDLEILDTGSHYD